MQNNVILALHCERSLLGGLLHGPSDMDSILAGLHGDEFTRPEHQRLFEAIREMHQEGLDIDLVTLTDRLRGDNGHGLKQVGGSNYLIELMEEVADGSNADYWVKRLKELALKRFAAQGADILAEYAADPSKSAEEVLEKQREINQRLSDRRLHLVSPQAPEEAEPFQFPNVMRGVAGAFAALYSSFLEVPAHFFYVGFLTCLGVVLAARLTLASEIAPQPRLFTLLLGESADDRKSTALSKVVEFFKTALEEFGVCWGIGSAEGLQKRLEESPRLLLCLDEFKQFVSKCRIEASVLLPCVNTLFESNRYESRTKHTDIKLESAYLSMLAASTVQTYESIWDPSFTAIGFNNRLFLCPGSGERKFSIPAKVPEDKKHELARGLADILRVVGPRLELEITPGARAIFDSWYLSMDRSIHTKRLDTYALRLMSLLAVNELKEVVDEEVVEQAIALCDWQLEVREILDPIDATNVIAKMEEGIRRVTKRAKGPLKDYELKQKTGANRAGLWVYMNAKKNLIAAGEIKENPKTKQIYRVRP